MSFFATNMSVGPVDALGKSVEWLLSKGSELAVLWLLCSRRSACISSGFISIYFVCPLTP